jgi:hypothetical protein
MHFHCLTNKLWHAKTPGLRLPVYSCLTILGGVAGLILATVSNPAIAQFIKERGSILGLALIILAVIALIFICRRTQ